MTYRHTKNKCCILSTLMTNNDNSSFYHYIVKYSFDFWHVFKEKKFTNFQSASYNSRLFKVFGFWRFLKLSGLILVKQYAHQWSQESGITIPSCRVLQEAWKSETGSKYGKIWVRFWGAASKQEIKHMLHAIFAYAFPKTAIMSNLLNTPSIELLKLNVAIFFRSGWKLVHPFYLYRNLQSTSILFKAPIVLYAQTARYIR